MYLLKDSTTIWIKTKNNYQYLYFRCEKVYIKKSLKKIGISCKLQPSLLKQKIDHDEIYEETWEDEEIERLPYLKNDLSSAAVSYVSYSKGMEELTGFGMKNSITLLSLADKFLNSLRDKSDEPIYTYDDENMRTFVRHSIKGSRCAA